MPKHLKPWIRAITADEESPSNGATNSPQQSANATDADHSAPGDGDEDSGEENDDEESPAQSPAEDSNASKVEKDDSQEKSVESTSDDKKPEDPDGRGSKRAVLEDLARERKKRQSVESERDELAERLKKLEQENAARERKENMKAALAKANLPAEMADRLKGESLEELTEDAEKLAKSLGYDRSAIDPGQGKTKAPKPATLADAIKNHYVKE
ncbi:TPA: hypothetical protein ACGIY5_001459 [Corynebacterium striatum]